jgi:hypothetical protein
MRFGRARNLAAAPANRRGPQCKPVNDLMNYASSAGPPALAIIPRFAQLSLLTTATRTSGGQASASWVNPH